MLGIQVFTLSTSDDLHRRVSGPALPSADRRSLVTTGELAIMPEWQEKPHPSAKKPTRGHSLISSIKWRAWPATIDLDWPEDERADAYRRLSRLTRASRLARETREEVQRFNGQAAASPAVVSVSPSSSTIGQRRDAVQAHAVLVLQGDCVLGWNCITERVLQ